MKGNFPFAVLHRFKTEGFTSAVQYAQSICREVMSKKEAVEYLKAVIKTEGQPKLLDLYE